MFSTRLQLTRATSASSSKFFKIINIYNRMKTSPGWTGNFKIAVAASSSDILSVFEIWQEICSLRFLRSISLPIFYDNIGGWLALLFLIFVFPFLIFYLHTMVIQINLFNYGNSLCKSYWQTLQHLFLGQHVNDTIILLYDSMILWYLGGSSLCRCCYLFFFCYLLFSPWRF